MKVSLNLVCSNKHIKLYVVCDVCNMNYINLVCLLILCIENMHIKIIMMLLALLL